MTRLGLLGFGEAGSQLAAGMQLAADDGVAAFDPVLVEDAARRERAEAAGVRVLDRLEELRKCDVVFALVTPAAALPAAQGYAAHAPAGQLYIDGNSTAPPVKQAIAEVLEPLGVRVVDAVLTGGGIQLDGHRIPISLAGADAEETAALLRRLGLVADAIGTTVGQAAAMKMLRGVVIKGLEALSVEALTAARSYGLEETVLDSLTETLDRWDIRDFVSMLVRSHTMHCGRRSVEVRMIRETVEATGLEPVMMEAAQRLFERSAAQDLSRADGRPPETLSEGVDLLVDALID
jgi:3-hydroxyisobutyrate dehydrogenase-like beta-hydroxyacid dehydrogenase